MEILASKHMIRMPVGQIFVSRTLVEFITLETGVEDTCYSTGMTTVRDQLHFNG